MGDVLSGQSLLSLIHRPYPHRSVVEDNLAGVAAHEDV